MTGNDNTVMLVHFGLGERTGNTEHPAALVGADADHREHGGVAHHANEEHLAAGCAKLN